MRKNRVKISQSKPKKGQSDNPADMKSSESIKEQKIRSDSYSDLEIPLEPSSRVPTITLKTIQNEFDMMNESEIKFNSSEFLETLNKPEELSQSELEVTSDHVNEEYSELNASQPKDLINQIKELQKEVSQMNERILDTEEEIKEKENEALELKELLIKLRENQFLVLESSEVDPNCKSCVVI